MPSPFDNIPTFNCPDLKAIFPGVDESKLANVDLRLDEGRSLTVDCDDHLFRTLTRSRRVFTTLDRLPGRTEAIHCVLNGEFALFDFIPAVHQLAAAPIRSLLVATLGFSKQNVAELEALADAGHLGDVGLLCSHYFSAADKPIYEQMTTAAEARGWRTAAMRQHAKLLLMTVGEHHITIESSANARSCRNIETATVFNSPDVYEFHAAWINEMLTKGASHGSR